MLEVNQKAPEFSLKNQNDVMIHLKDYLGQKVVLYFYPKDNTPGCTKQACLFRDYNQALKEKGIVVLGISKDDVTSHDKFSQKYDLNFDILSDPSLDVLHAYGVYKEKTVFGKTALGIERSTFLIDEEGNLEKIMRKVSPKDNPKEVYEYFMGKE